MSPLEIAKLVSAVQQAVPQITATMAEFPADRLLSAGASYLKKSLYEYEMKRERDWDEMAREFGVDAEQAKALYRMVITYCFRKES